MPSPRRGKTWRPLDGESPVAGWPYPYGLTLALPFGCTSSAQDHFQVFRPLRRLLPRLRQLGHLLVGQPKLASTL
jgi:hypothetical protein